MAYGTIKVDNITFTDNSVDKTVSLSGLIQNPTFTGNVTATGTISGDVIRGGTTISGVTVTGTTANFVSGVFTTQVSGVTIIATTGTFTSLTGTTTTGTTANFVSGVFTTRVSGTTITGTTVATTTGSFVSLTGTTATFTSGIIASGTAALPSLAILSDPNTGIYSPGADQLAISTAGSGRLLVDSAGRVGVNKTPGTGAGSNQRVQIKQIGDTYDGLQIEKFDDDSILGIGVFSSVWTFNATSVTTGSYLPIRFNLGGSERLRITSAGLVGIGTSSPAQLLHVSGSGTQAIRLENTLGTGNVSLELKLTGNTFTIGHNNTSIYFLDTAGREYIWYQGANERIRIDTSGRLLVGTSTANTSGAKLQTSDGLTFPATQVASTDPNTLDDYEEGTFTPTIVGAVLAGIGIYSIQVGRYTKTGNRVNFSVYIVWSAHTGTGEMRVAAMPFASSSATNVLHAVSIWQQDITLTASNVMMGYFLGNNTQIALSQTPTGGGAQTAVPMDGSGHLIVTGVYEV